MIRVLEVAEKATESGEFGWPAAIVISVLIIVVGVIFWKLID